MAVRTQTMETLIGREAASTGQLKHKPTRPQRAVMQKIKDGLSPYVHCNGAGGRGHVTRMLHKLMAEGYLKLSTSGLVWILSEMGAAEMRKAP